MMRDVCYTDHNAATGEGEHHTKGVCILVTNRPLHRLPGTLKQSDFFFPSTGSRYKVVQGAQRFATFFSVWFENVSRYVAKKH